MKKWMCLGMALLMLCLTACAAGTGKNVTGGDQARKTITAPSGKQYTLTLDDEFDGERLNTKYWLPCPEQERQDIGGRWKNGLYEIKEGNLWLWAKIDEDGTPVSGAVRSYGLFEQAYGYYEARMMFPRTTGFWAAFWMICGDMVAGDGTGTNGSEIDIIETGECPRRAVNHAVHCNGYGPECKSISEIVRDESLYEGWHTYALEWTPEEYIFYIDGKETWRTTGYGVCQRPGYLKLTTEFGSWAAPIVPEELPDCARFDYVRVYAVPDGN